jgi:carboxyl-terminal processing protease
MKIDGKDIEGMDIEDVALLIRGEAGTSVTLTVEKAGLLKTYTMVRKVIKTESVSYKMLEDQIGYIGISGFDSNTDDEFFEARLILLSQGMKGLVIDVRNNGGGWSVHSKTEMPQLWSAKQRTERVWRRLCRKFRTGRP